MASSPFTYRLEYLGMLVLIGIFRVLPQPLCNALAALLGRFTFLVLKLRRNTVLRNLAEAFPEKSPDEIAAIARRTYQHMAAVFFEFLRFPVLKKRFRELVALDGADKVDRKLAKGKGVLLVSAHFGSWEVLAASFPAYGYKLTAIARVQKNQQVDTIINDYRRRMGTNIIMTGMNVREAVKSLKNNEIFYILADQDAGRNGVFVDFFGQPASTPPGAALFHLKTGAPILVCMTVRNPDRTYTVHVEEMPPLDLTGDKEKDVQIITQAYTGIIETYIRRYPDQWMWMHNRWRAGRKKARLEQ